MIELAKKAIEEVPQRGRMTVAMGAPPVVMALVQDRSE